MNTEYGAMVRCDSSKCSSCKACELACFAAHCIVGKTVGTVTVPVRPRLFVEADGPVQCRHCEDAPCLNSCASKAISRIHNQVIMDTKKCTNCVKPDCAQACPFGAIRLLPDAAKCDLCFHKDTGPACVATCPNQALRLVEPELDRYEKNTNVLLHLKFLT